MTREEKIMQGSELRNARIKKRWSQMMLAEQINVSRPYITRMENGRKPLNKKALDFIASVESQSDPYLGIGQEKTAKKDTKTELIINELQEQMCPKNGQFDEVTDISESEQKNQWEKWWFEDKNALCDRCQKKCKQSIFVDIIECPQFKEK